MAKYIFFIAGIGLTLSSTAQLAVPVGNAKDDDKNFLKEACVSIGYSVFSECRHVRYGGKIGAYTYEFGNVYCCLYGVSAVLIDMGGHEEIMGGKCGLLNWCSSGSGFLIGGLNFASDFAGADIGLFNCFAARSRSFLTSEVSGLMLGFVNVNESHFALQTGAVNAQSLLEHGFSAQIGLWNIMKLNARSRGMQIGLYNDAELEEASILQIGTFNCVRQEEGEYVQIGVLNCSNAENSNFFLPLLSIGF